MWTRKKKKVKFSTKPINIIEISGWETQSYDIIIIYNKKKTHKFIH